MLFALFGATVIIGFAFPPAWVVSGIILVAWLASEIL